MEGEALPAGGPSGGESGSSSPAPAAEPSSSSSSSSSPAKSSPTPAPQWPSHDEFKWDDWDGTPASWPEQVRPWGERMYSRLDGERTDLQTKRDLYDSLLNSSADPRMTELQTKHEELQAKHQEIEQARTAAEQSLQAYKQGWETYAEQEATQYAERFTRQHQDVFVDATKKGRFEELLDANIDPDDAVEAARLGDTAYETVKAALSEKVPFAWAMKHAQAEQERVTPKPRAGAKLTSGAISRTPPPNATTNIESRKPKSFNDIRENAAAKAIALHSRRK